MKTYILQKDLPFVRAGAGINSVEGGFFSIKNDNGKGAYLFSKEQIETASEWFKEVPDLYKPPLGLMPKYLHDERRLDDIREAKDRYNAEGKVVPQEWIEEEKELLEAMKNRHDSALTNEEKIKNDAERFFNRSCDVMKIEIDKSAIYFQKGDEGFAFDAQYVFKKLAGL